MTTITLPARFLFIVLFLDVFFYLFNKLCKCAKVIVRVCVCVCVTVHRCAFKHIIYSLQALTPSRRCVYVMRLFVYNCVCVRVCVGV